MAKKRLVWASEMAQQIKALTVQACDLSSSWIPWWRELTHKVVL